MARIADYMVLVFLILLVLREVMALEMVIPVWLNVAVCVVASGVVFLMLGRDSREKERMPE